MQKFAFMIAGAAALGAGGCQSHQAKCDEAMKRLESASIEAARSAAGEDEGKLKALWTGVLNDSDRGQKECAAATDNRTGLVLENVHATAQGELDGIAAQPAYEEWKGKYCAERWGKVSPEVTRCCTGTVVQWTATACQGKERHLVAVLAKVGTVCRTLAGAECKQSESNQADGTVMYEGGSWHVEYCPAKNCPERHQQLREIRRRLGAPDSWHRTGLRWSVEWDGDDKPKVSPEQDALLKKYADGMGPDE